MPTKVQKPKVLVCKDWQGRKTFLKCKTCNDTFPITINIPSYDKLYYVEREAV